MAEVVGNTVRKSTEPVQDRQSPSTLGVTLKIQPAGFYAAIPGKVVDVATVGNYIVASFVDNEKSEVKVFDQAGAIARELRSRLTMGEVAQELGKIKKAGLYVDLPTYGPSANAALLDGKLLESWLIPASAQGQITADLKAKNIRQGQDNNGARYYTADELMKAGDALFWSTNYKLHSDPNDRGVALEGKGFFRVLVTKDENGAVIPAADWKTTWINSIDQASLKTFPFLATVAKSNGREAISETEYSVEVERGLLKLTRTGKAELAFSDEATAYLIARGAPPTLYYLASNGREIKHFSLDKVAGVNTPVETQALPFSGIVKGLRLDQNGNFLFAEVEENGERRLCILERDSLTVAATIPNLGEKFDLDNDGNVAYIDSEGRLRAALTNLSQFPEGGLKTLRLQRVAELTELDAALAEIELPAAPRNKRPKLADASLNEAQIIERAQARLIEAVRPELQGATSIDAVAMLVARIDALKQDAAYSKYPGIFEAVDNAIAARLDEIRVGELTTKVSSLSKLAVAVTDPEQLPTLDAEQAKVLRFRRGLVIANADERVRVDTDLKRINGLITQAHIKAQSLVDKTLQDKLDVMQSMFAAAMSIAELNLAQGDKTAFEFSSLLSTVRDPGERQRWSKAYAALITTRQSEINLEIETQESHERAQAAQGLEESATVLAEIAESLKATTTPAEIVTLRRTSPLLGKFQAKLQSLPEEFRTAESKKMEGLFTARSKVLESKKAVVISTNGSEVSFGDASFPIFQDVPVVWQPKVVPSQSGALKGRLVYTSNTGHTFEVSCEPVSIDLSDPKTQAAIEQSRGAATAYFQKLTRTPVGFNEKWVVNDYYRGILSKVARLSKIQIRDQEGITILEGEAGTGKNAIIDQFAHFTNRESHTFSCNFQTEKEDVTYAFKFDPQRGTYQVDSEFVRRLQTPGSIVVLDEINALPTGVAKMLNPLLDYRRCLYLPDGRVIRVDPSVIIFGAMNPQYYLGVKPLSQEVKSRARIMNIDYPPEKYPKGTKVAPYEAEMLAQWMPDLAGLKQAEFYAAWDYVMNSDTTSGGERFLTKDREKSIKALGELVRSANRVREAHRAFRSGKSTDAVEFVFSLRESIQITKEFLDSGKMKAAIKEVVIPKISDPEEKDRVGIIVDNA